MQPLFCIGTSHASRIPARGRFAGDAGCHNRARNQPTGPGRQMQPLSIRGAEASPRLLSFGRAATKGITALSCMAILPLPASHSPPRHTDLASKPHPHYPTSMTDLLSLITGLQSDNETTRATPAESPCLLAEAARSAAVQLIRGCADESGSVREWAVDALLASFAQVCQKRSIFEAHHKRYE